MLATVSELKASMAISIAAKGIKRILVARKEILRASVRACE